MKILGSLYATADDPDKLNLAKVSVCYVYKEFFAELLENPCIYTQHFPLFSNWVCWLKQMWLQTAQNITIMTLYFNILLYDTFPGP